MNGSGGTAAVVEKPFPPRTVVQAVAMLAGISGPQLFSASVMPSAAASKPAWSYETNQSYACLPPLEKLTWSVSVCTLPVVAGISVKSVRCGTDIPSKYCECIGCRTPPIQWQLPRPVIDPIVSFSAHCLKSVDTFAPTR